MNVEGPENLHKEWVKAQGGKTNKGPTLHKTPMTHCLRKEESALLSCTYTFISYKSAFLLDLYIFVHILHLFAYFAYFLPLFLTGRIDDDDPGYGSDASTQHDPRTGQAHH